MKAKVDCLKFSKIIVSAIVLLITSSCGLKNVKKKKRPPEPTEAIQEERGPKRPSWVDNPQESCISVREICTVGEGHSKLSPEHDALKNLAQYFKTNVSSTTRSSKEMEQKTQGDTIIEGRVQKDVSQSVKASTQDVLLRGIEFKRRYDDQEESVYVFASLHRRRVANLLRDEIKIVDDKLRTYYKRKKRSYFRSMLTLYRTR